MLDAYNEEVSALEYQDFEPDYNLRDSTLRDIERDELKKGTIRIMTDEFSRIVLNGKVLLNVQFDSMKENLNQPFPEFDVDEADEDGQIISFFEDSFEWENITYEFLPYHWGRKNKWIESNSVENSDVDFSSFLKAGAAKVVVPVSPAHQDRVLHFLSTKEIWNNDFEPPVINREPFLSIVEELKSDTVHTPPELLPEFEEGI